jgi:hypothetical protein
MGAASLLEDIRERWDEMSPELYSASPACPSNASVPPDDGVPPILRMAFEELFDRLEVAGDLLKRRDLNDSWQAIAHELDRLYERISGFNRSLPLAQARRDIHDHAAPMHRDIEQMRSLWSRFIGELAPLIGEIGRLAIEVQRLNPEHHAEHLTARHVLAREVGNSTSSVM